MTCIVRPSDELGEPCAGCGRDGSLCMWDCPVAADRDSRGPVAPDHVPEGERIARRERAKLEGGRARKRRLGLRRDR